MNWEELMKKIGKMSEESRKQAVHLSIVDLDGQVYDSALVELKRNDDGTYYLSGQ